MTAVLALLGLVLLLGAGAYAAAALDHAVHALIARRPAGGALSAPMRGAAAHLLRQRVSTERPDALNWLLAPACYLALAAIGLSVVPFAPGVVAADLEGGIVLWGTCEALTVVVVFLHGWSANAPFPLIGGYRYVAIGLPVMLLSMFVLIAAALPAESLAVPDIVESQRSLWNVVRQPIGLPLFLMLGLALTLRGPFDYADPRDLAGGTSAEVSGPALALIVSFLSLVGIPPLAGFFGKLTLILATIDGGYAWLAAVAVANTVVSLFYYLRIIAPMCFGAAEGRPAVLGRATAAAVWLGLVLVVGLGLAAEATFEAIGRAATFAGTVAR